MGVIAPARAGSVPGKWPAPTRQPGQYGPRQTGPRARTGGQMHYGIDAVQGAVESGGIAHIPPDEGEPPATGQLADGAELYRPIVERVQVVQSHDVVSRIQQRATRVPADEPGSTGDQDPPAHAASDCLKYEIVRRSPSSRPTRGSQPSSARARVMSGRRCLGSSVGSG